MGRKGRGSDSDTAHPYLRFWGLAEAPFQLEPDARFTYDRADHREGLARMLFGLTQLGGIVAITGEIGCGKTMLGRALARTLTGDGFRLVTIANPPRTPAGLLAALLGALGEERTGGGAARLASRLRGRLSDLDERGERPTVMVDEAQRLDARALDELRLLTNPGDGPAVPVVILGQPELGARIARIPQVEQRVVVRYHLGPMPAAEVGAYVQHRTRVAGATRSLFSDRATMAVWSESGGVPRIVNLLCANALFVAYSRGDIHVEEDLVRDLADDRRFDADRGATSPLERLRVES